MKPAATMMVGLMLGWGASANGPADQSRQAGDQQTETKLAATMSGIVLIKVGQGHGTGVVIDAKERLVVTNAHVVRGHRTVTVRLRNGAELEGRVIYIARGGLDLAMVRIAGTSAPAPGPNNAAQGTVPLRAVALGCRLPRAPEQVTAIGHPGPFRWAVSKGHVAGEFNKAKALGRGLVLDLTIWHGNSGGGLFDAQGRLVGITTAIFGRRTMTSRVYSGFSFAISGIEVCNFAKRVRAAFGKQIASR